ncbi:MAG: alkyl sulfatase dimerization domain-containing protein [Pseudomonadota bacterium]
MDQESAKDAQPLTRAVHAAIREALDFDDGRDLEDASRGLIAAVPNDGRIENAKGGKIWDLGDYAFLGAPGDPDIDTVNPSLLRLARLNMSAGLFQVTDRVYQVRGMDLANMTIVEGETGILLIDCLMTAETAAAALALYRDRRGERPVKALIYTHSHVDHYGGARGALDPSDVAAGRADVFAPDGFLEALGGENILAGTAMSRRAQFQFGPLLRPGPRGQVDAGLGKVTARGRITLIAPNRIITEPVETHVIDGVEVRFHLAPGTEAPAEMHMYLPQMRVLNMAENATPMLHNFVPLRGSEVRDPRIWSHYLSDAAERFGGEAEILVSQHHWPIWGREAIVEHLARQRDLYKHIHDQTVRLMNKGWRPAEIAEAVDLPVSLGRDWKMRGYYGSVAHNAKAVFQRYLSWYDGAPANLSPLPPRAAARKYLDYMGGAEAVMSRARADFEAGEFRWVAQVLYHVLFADPGNAAAKALAADAFEQLGYQAENATWRNAYLYAAQELREGVVKLPPRSILSPDLLEAVETVTLFDFMAVRLDAAKAEGLHRRIAWRFPERGEEIAQTLRHETLTQIIGKRFDAPDAAATLSRVDFVQLLVRRLTVAEALETGALTVDGDASVIEDLFAMLDDFELQFDVVAPSE